MVMAHLSYVICNHCGLPASEPMEDAKAARRMVPSNWTRPMWNKRVDLCPEHSANPEDKN
jgi:hypothetical protein